MMFLAAAASVRSGRIGTSTGYLVLVVIASARFRRDRPCLAPGVNELPAVTLLKPLCGTGARAGREPDQLLRARLSRVSKSFLGRGGPTIRPLMLCAAFAPDIPTFR